jgi:transcriptional regulator with XRE-family HTH domain
MLKVGQPVQTSRGSGVVSSIGDSSPYVYVRLNSGPDEIYVMDRSDLRAEEADARGYVGWPRASDGLTSHQIVGAAPATGPKREGVAVERRMPRCSNKRQRASAETPIAVFVNARLAELGLKQCEFCRKTGFDQGLLSRIQSSTSSNLSLESCLRLAIGCSVPPEKIFDLVGRPEFHSLITKSYSNSKSIPEPEWIGSSDLTSALNSSPGE